MKKTPAKRISKKPLTQQEIMNLQALVAKKIGALKPGEKPNSAFVEIASIGKFGGLSTIRKYARAMQHPAVKEALSNSSKKGRWISKWEGLAPADSNFIRRALTYTQASMSRIAGRLNVNEKLVAAVQREGNYRKKRVLGINYLSRILEKKLREAILAEFDGKESKKSFMARCADIREKLEPFGFKSKIGVVYNRTNALVSEGKLDGIKLGRSKRGGHNLVGKKAQDLIRKLAVNSDRFYTVNQIVAALKKRNLNVPGIQTIRNRADIARNHLTVDGWRLLLLNHNRFASEKELMRILQVNEKRLSRYLEIDKRIFAAAGAQLEVLKNRAKRSGKVYHPREAVRARKKLYEQRIRENPKYVKWQ